MRKLSAEIHHDNKHSIYHKQLLAKTTYNESIQKQNQPEEYGFPKFKGSSLI